VLEVGQLCHVSIIAPSEDQQQAVFAERCGVGETLSAPCGAALIGA